MVRVSYIYTTARCGLLDGKALFLLSKEAINYKRGWKFSTLNFNLTNLNMLLLIFKVGIQLRTPKSVIETHKIQKLDFFKCPPVRPWCSGSNWSNIMTCNIKKLKNFVNLTFKRGREPNNFINNKWEITEFLNFSFKF